MKIAIVHDFITKIGGAEKVLQEIHKIFPDAPIYTLLYDKVGTKREFSSSDYKIITSGLQKLPKSLRRRHRYLISKFPQAIENFDLSQFDIVISSSNSFAHGVITRPQTLHITYCYSPTRYLWDWSNEYLSENKVGFGFKGLYIRHILSKQRIWDFLASKRSDKFVAISKTVASRIKKYYKVDSEIIYPPVKVDEFLKNSEKAGDYYLIVSRLTQYKKIDLAISAFNKLKLPLHIIGEGSDSIRLKSLANDNNKFIGWVSEKDKIEALKKCKAFIFPGEDDFGIAPVEAMATGRPVIAYKSGGATETVVEGKTGEFFSNPNNPNDLILAVKKLEKNYQKYNVSDCKNQAKKFSQEIFVEKFKKYVLSEYEKYQTKKS